MTRRTAFLLAAAIGAVVAWSAARAGAWRAVEASMERAFAGWDTGETGDTAHTDDRGA